MSEDLEIKHPLSEALASVDLGIKHPLSGALVSVDLAIKNPLSEALVSVDLGIKNPLSEAFVSVDLGMRKHKLLFWWFSSLFCRGPPISFTQKPSLFPVHGHILPFINTTLLFW